MSKLLIPCLVLSVASCSQVAPISPGCRGLCHPQQEQPFGICIKACPDCHDVKKANRTDNMAETYLDIFGQERTCTHLCASAAAGGSERECMDNCPKTWCVKYGDPSLFTTITQPPTTTPQPPTQQGMKDTRTSSLATSVSPNTIIISILVPSAILLGIICLLIRRFKHCKKQQMDEEETVACACTDVTTDAVEETGGAYGERPLLTLSPPAQPTNRNSVVKGLMTTTV